jgi:phosphoribosylformylglycinamidine synthase
MTSEPEVTTELAREHGLNDEEFALTKKLLGRDPNFTELGIFSAMWNEHCSYKSSKYWLRTLPTEGVQVIQGPGENAGIVDIGDGQAIVFKMESHNHPSYIEPFQGAATGVGGILRDVFTMGARPIAALNSLSFGDPSHEKTRYLVNGVVHGIAHYGNCFGVPTVGGEVRFDKSYNGNCLVNAFAAGLIETDKIFYSAASGIGMPVVYLGAKTGRDGVGGATMASAEFDDTIDEKRPTVQVGDPFTQKRLLEACLELMETGAVISIQDMGAAGLTCSAVEMGDKGNLGIRLNLENVPTREENMTAYEMMLSESQERMLMVLHPEKQDQAKAIFDKWDLDFAVVGETIAEDKFLIYHNGVLKADLPLKALSGNAPEYKREVGKPKPPAPLETVPVIDPIDALQRLLQSQHLCSRRWVWEQYDHMVMGDTIRHPGGDAALVRVHGTKKAVALTLDVTPRYCKANPVEGGKQAVAEAYRNISATGAKPLATTDNLNFGNPEKKEIMGQFVGCIQGIGQACKALDMPIVSGNVSLYNETHGDAIMPTPTIGAVGLLDNYEKALDMTFKKEGDVILVIGAPTTGHMGQSLYLKALFNKHEGDAPHVDLDLERRAGDFIRSMNDTACLTACHDVSDGGLAIAIVEMALAGKIGAEIKMKSGLEDIYWLYGEDQGRYVVTCDLNDVEDVHRSAREHNLHSEVIGSVGGDDITFGNHGKINLYTLQALHESWFPDYMKKSVVAS